MSSHIRQIFLGALHSASSVKDVIEALGDPEDTGQGLRGFVILANRERSIQFTLKAGGLLLVALYFSPNAPAPSWPDAFQVPATLSAQMGKMEVEHWLRQRALGWACQDVAGEPCFDLGAGVRLCFEEGRFRSVQIWVEGGDV